MIYLYLMHLKTLQIAFNDYIVHLLIPGYWNPQSAEFIILTIRFGTMLNSDSWRGNPKRTLWTRVCWLDDRGRNKSKTCGCIGKCFTQTGDSQIRCRPSHCISVITLRYAKPNQRTSALGTRMKWKYSKTPVNMTSAITANWTHWKRKLKMHSAALLLSPGSSRWFAVSLQLEKLQKHTCLYRYLLVLNITIHCKKQSMM